VGDQFGEQNKHLLEKVFGWFYLSINLGAFVSSWIVPDLLANPRFGPRCAFGLPGVLMFVATVIFWLGRKKFVHIPPGGAEFVREAFSIEGLKILGRVSVIYLFVAFFWSLYDQSGAAWVLQAKEMNRVLVPESWFPAWPTWWPEAIRPTWAVS